MKKIIIYLKQTLVNLVYPVKVWLFGDPSMIIRDEDDEFAMGMSMIGYNKRKRLIADWKAGKLKSRKEQE